MLPAFSFVALYKQSVPFIWMVTSRRVDSRDEYRAWKSSITNTGSRLETNQTKKRGHLTQAVTDRGLQVGVHSPFGMFACSLQPGIITEGDSPLKASATHSGGRGCFEVVLIRRQKKFLRGSRRDARKTQRHSAAASREAPFFPLHSLG